MRTLIGAVAGLAICGVVVMAQGAGDPAKGSATYVEKKCGTCHKRNQADEKGGKLSTVLADHVGKLSVDEIKGWLADAPKMEAKLPKKPVMPMSTYLKSLKPALTPAEVSNLVAYLQTLPGK